MKILTELRDLLRKRATPDAAAFLSATQIHEVISHAPAMRDAILDCPSSQAAQLLEKLKAFRETSPVVDYATSGLIYATRGEGRLTKILTTLHLAGFRISEMSSLSFESRRIRAFADHLDAMGASAHRRMESFRLEPSPAAVLARPWWHDFYGKNTSRFPGDIRIWQRFLQPYIDPHFGPRAFIVWMIIGGIFGAIALSMIVDIFDTTRSTTALSF